VTREDAAAPEWILEAARARGPIAPEGYRVVVVEPSGGLSVTDFDDRASAERYANDAASESDPAPPLAYVLGDGFRLVARGRHY
jgi:hypothetical protein